MRVTRFSARWLYTILFVLSLSLNSLTVALRPQAQAQKPAKDASPAGPTTADVAGTSRSAQTAAASPSSPPPAAVRARPAMASAIGIAQTRTVIEDGEDVGPESDIPPGAADAEVLQPQAEDFLSPSDLEEILPPEPAPDQRERKKPVSPRRQATGGAADSDGAAIGSGGGRLAWPVSGQVTSGYGRRGSKWHKGIDIAGSSGSEIRAAESGVVTLARWYGGYGRAVIVDHGGGLSTLYGHNSRLLVSEGDRVEKGQAIALRGSTGRSTGPHLHFEVRVNGEPVNPWRYLK